MKSDLDELPTVLYRHLCKAGRDMIHFLSFFFLLSDALHLSSAGLCVTDFFPP